jgi:hypothetical protein
MTIFAFLMSSSRSCGTSSRVRVVVVRVVRLQHAQAVADRQARRDDEEAAGERLAARAADRVQRLPGDEHRHHRRLAGPRGQLQREPVEARVRLGVDRLQVLEQPLARARCGATSVNQMAVSTASIWQKNGRTPPKSWCRQCFSSRAVSGVTCHWLSGRARQASTWPRTSLILDVRSYACFSVVRPRPSSRTEVLLLRAPRRFFGFGIGVTNEARRRRSIRFPVGWPDSSSSQCWRGYSYGAS